MAPPMVVTEDTPPDMLAGSMDLCVILPDGHSLNMSVDRSTPMMDLLVQLTTANKMSPAGYTIKPHNDRGPLPYKPSTPIGALDAWSVHIVPKLQNQCTAIKRPLKTLNQPFEQTFRLQVHLPRNQLYVARVSPRTRLGDILLQVCAEKNLDPIKYSLRHPNNLDQVLNTSCSLADYKLQEVTVVSNRGRPVEVSAVDIMSLRRDASAANPAYRNHLCEGSVSSGSLEGRSLSPAPSDESSASPPPPPPSRPTRKRRPAPKPPVMALKPPPEEQKPDSRVQTDGVTCSTATATTTTMIHHSRNSSDSSGYHEASVLSESPQTNCVAETLAQRTIAVVSETAPYPTSLQQAAAYPSTTSLSSITGRKKKSAPPPPTVIKTRASSLIEEGTQKTPSVSSTASSTTTLDGNEAATGFKSATLPPSSRLNSVPLPDHPNPSTPRAPAPRSRPRPISALGPAPAPASPSRTKPPAPQPRPRTLAPSKPLDISTGQNKRPESTEEFLNQKQQISDRSLQKSVLSSHIACIAEMANKFGKNKSTDRTAPGEGELKTENILVNQPETPVEYQTYLEDTPYVHKKPSAASAWVKGSVSEPDGGILDIMADEEIDRIFTNATENHSGPENDHISSDDINLPKLLTPPPFIEEETKQSSQTEEPADWEYRLPAPPTFRDEARSPSVTELGTVTIGHLEDILCSDIAQEQEINDNVEKNLASCETNSATSEVSNVEDCVKSNSETNPNPVIAKKTTLNYKEHKPGSVAISSVTVETNGRCNYKELENSVIKELTSTLSRHSSKLDINHTDAEHLPGEELATSSTLENFKITTYKDTKPVEVFEDDSIKSSAGEKRDKSKDDAVFRAPKARVKEPHLSRRSSFNVEGVGGGGGPPIKRSVSYVSLLAANMPRHSQPYRAMLQRQRGDDGWPRLRKTTSELDIDGQGKGSSECLWKDDSTELQSVQVLRKILSRSHANLSDLSETPSVQHQQRNDQPYADYDEKIHSAEFGEESDNKDWSRSKNEKVNFGGNYSEFESSKPALEESKTLHSESFKPSVHTRGPPAINLSTWTERPKRQISIKKDSDYVQKYSESASKSTLLNANISEAPQNESTLKDLEKNVQLNLVDSFKLDLKSRSTTDLSRIPIVRSVELKKPFTAHQISHTTLKSVLKSDDNNVAKHNVNTKNSPLGDNNSEEDNFIGVNSLARKFGIPQKRPVSMYSTSSEVTYSLNNKFDSVKHNNTLPNKQNYECTVNESRNVDNKSLIVNTPLKIIDINHKENSSTSQIKALSRTRSGGFVDTNKSVIGCPSEFNSKHSTCTYLSKDDEVTFPQPFHQKSFDQVKINSTYGGNDFASTAQPEPCNVRQRLSTPGPNECQRQTLDKRERPANLQPVVKGFRVTGESKNVSSLPSQAKDLSPHSGLSKKFNLENRHKTYHRELCAPNASSLTSNSNGSTKETIEFKPRSSDDVVSKVGGKIPAPPAMPVLKPVGERKGIKLLPPPEAKPRDQLMESIRGFGIDSLKKVTTKYSAPLYL